MRLLEILFLNDKTGEVNYAITDISRIRYITPSEIGFTYADGRDSCHTFSNLERLEISHKSNSPLREALRRVVKHA